MRILITGAAGTLGSSLLPRLASRGHEAVGLDVVAGAGDWTWIQADVRDAQAMRTAVKGFDVVVHAAALHGIHLADHDPREFYDLNVTGTFNVWQAAVAGKVRGLVFSSTMGVYGDSRRPVSDQAVAFLDEEAPLLPGDVYGWTKVVGEELCRYHVRHDGIPSIALRYGMFVPETFFRYGIRLLYGGVDEADVVEAVMAAVETFEQREVGYEVYNVESPLPFTAADSRSLRTDPLGAIERHWPGATELLRAHGVRSLRPITEVFPVRRLEDGLGIRLTRDFGSWLDQLASRPGDHASADPPWP